MHLLALALGHDDQVSDLGDLALGSRVVGLLGNLTGAVQAQECATAICSLPRPIRLLARRMVTFSIVVPSLAQDLGNGLAALSSDALGVGQAAQACEGSSSDVDGVVGTQALGADVLDAGALEHGTDGAAGQNAGTGAAGRIRTRPAPNSPTIS